MTPPAFFAGRAVASTIEQPVAALVVGVVAALALELVGILAAHAGIELWKLKRQDLFKFAAGVYVTYLLIGISLVWLTETGTAAIVGSGFFVVAGLSYVSVALMYMVDEEKNKRTEAAQRAARTRQQNKANKGERTKNERRAEREQSEHKGTVKERVLAAAELGGTYREIAERAGVKSTSTVSRYLSKNGATP